MRVCIALLALLASSTMFADTSRFVCDVVSIEALPYKVELTANNVIVKKCSDLYSDEIRWSLLSTIKQLKGFCVYRELRLVNGGASNERAWYFASEPNQTGCPEYGDKKYTVLSGFTSEAEMFNVFELVMASFSEAAARTSAMDLFSDMPFYRRWFDSNIETFCIGFDALPKHSSMQAIVRGIRVREDTSSEIVEYLIDVKFNGSVWEISSSVKDKTLRIINIASVL